VLARPCGRKGKEEKRRRGRRKKREKRKRGKKKEEKEKKKRGRKEKKEEKIGKRFWGKSGKLLGKLGRGFAGVFPGFSGVGAFSGTAVMARWTGHRDRGVRGIPGRWPTATLGRRAGVRPRCGAGGNRGTRVGERERERERENSG
jgi:hypothetical protein